MDSPVIYCPGKEDHICPGDFLFSEYSLYVVDTFLEHGAFATVVKCTRVNDNEAVAIKMIKNSRCLETFMEISNLHKLRKLNLDECNIVQWNGAFEDKGHLCLEFEQLDKSLRHLLEERNFQPLLIKEIRPIVQQLATALDHLNSIQLIHADLKLENVMLVNHGQAPFKVKLIDFSLACDKSATIVGSKVQNRFYRAPEILLGLPFNEAIDIWSLGCMVAELFLSTPLYPGSSSYNMMRYMVETQEMPPDSMLDSGVHTIRYFKRDPNTNLWSLKTPVEDDVKLWDASTRRINSLDDFLHIWPIRSAHFQDAFSELVDLSLFVDMLKAMLHLDASHRITPQQVLSHPFTSMSLFPDGPSSSYVCSCTEVMINCQRATKNFQKIIPDTPESPDPAPPQPWLSLIRDEKCGFKSFHTEEKKLF